MSNIPSPRALLQSTVCVVPSHIEVAESLSGSEFVIVTCADRRRAAR